MSAARIIGQTGVAALVTGDWDSDGDLDLAVANFSSNSITVLRNNGTGSFSLLSAVGGQIGINALAAGDWDGNGYLDLAAADSGSDIVYILTNQP